MTLYPQRFTCPHRACDCTPEDGEGYVICARCGAAIIHRITRERLARLVPYGLGHYPFPRDLGNPEDPEE
jgi:hypothetical protein